VDDLEQAVDSLDTEPIIVAHSMGALVAQRYLERHNLPAAVFLAPVPLGGAMRATLRTARKHPIEFLKANFTLDLGALVSNRDTARDLLFAADISDEDLDRYWPMLQSESYLAFLDMLLLTRARPQLVQTLVSIVAGSADHLFSVKELTRMSGVYGTELTVIDDAGHDLMLDPRWEQVAEAITGILEQ